MLDPLQLSLFRSNITFYATSVVRYRGNGKSQSTSSQEPSQLEERRKTWHRVNATILAEVFNHQLSILKLDFVQPVIYSAEF